MSDVGSDYEDQDDPRRWRGIRNIDLGNGNSILSFSFIFDRTLHLPGGHLDVRGIQSQRGSRNDQQTWRQRGAPGPPLHQEPILQTGGGQPAQQQPPRQEHRPRPQAQPHPDRQQQQDVQAFYQFVGSTMARLFHDREQQVRRQREQQQQQQQQRQANGEHQEGRQESREIAQAGFLQFIGATVVRLFHDREQQVRQRRQQQERQHQEERRRQQQDQTPTPPPHQQRQRQHQTHPQPRAHGRGQPYPQHQVNLARALRVRQDLIALGNALYDLRNQIDAEMSAHVDDFVRLIFAVGRIEEALAAEPG